MTTGVTPEIYLKRGKEGPLLRRHPWVFSGAVSHRSGAPKNGDFVAVFSHDNQPLGCGFFNDASIQVKLLGFGDETLMPLHEVCARRLHEALSVRKRLGLLDSAHTTGYRLVNGEGDSLPGLVVDRFGEVVVLQCFTPGTVANRELFASLLFEATLCTALIDKSKDSAGVLGSENSVIRGEWSGYAPFLENGIPFRADPLHGQKTGFFLDQRENRHLVRSHAGGRSVLNLFCYSGGFSFAAAAGGARRVVSVDSSAAALALLRDTARLQELPCEHEIIEGDVFEFLGNGAQRFDLVIVDPPAFSKSRDTVKEAVRGYQRLNEKAIHAVAPGGLLATFSCSQVVAREQFEAAVRAAAISSGRPCRIIHRLSQAPCHVMNMFHEEGEYLKGLILLFD